MWFPTQWLLWALVTLRIVPNTLLWTSTISPVRPSSALPPFPCFAIYASLGLNFLECSNTSCFFRHPCLCTCCSDFRECPCSIFLDIFQYILQGPPQFPSPLRNPPLLPGQLPAAWLQLTISSGSATPNSSSWSRRLHLLLSCPRLTKGLCLGTGEGGCWRQYSCAPHSLAIFPIDSGWKVITQWMTQHGSYYSWETTELRLDSWL